MLQIQLKTLQSHFNKANASRLQATAAAHHGQEACRAENAKNNQLTKENKFLTDEHEKLGHWMSSSASADVPFHEISNGSTPIYSTSVGEGPKSYAIRLGTVNQRNLLTPNRQKWFRSSHSWTREMSSLPLIDKE